MTDRSGIWGWDYEEHVYPEYAVPETWETKDGQVLKIKHMTDLHLQRTILFLTKRLNSQNAIYLEVMLLERDKRNNDGKKITKTINEDIKEDENER